MKNRQSIVLVVGTVLALVVVITTWLANRPDPGQAPSTAPTSIGAPAPTWTPRAPTNTPSPTGRAPQFRGPIDAGSGLSAGVEIEQVVTIAQSIAVLLIGWQCDNDQFCRALRGFNVDTGLLQWTLEGLNDEIPGFVSDGNNRLAFMTLRYDDEYAAAVPCLHVVDALAGRQLGERCFDAQSPTQAPPEVWAYAAGVVVFRVGESYQAVSDTDLTQVRWQSPPLSRRGVSEITLLDRWVLTSQGYADITTGQAAGFGEVNDTEKWFARNNSTFVADLTAQTLQVWDTTRNRAQWAAPIPWDSRSDALCADETTVVTLAGRSGEAIAYNATDGHRLWSWRAPDNHGATDCAVVNASILFYRHDPSDLQSLYVVDRGNARSIAQWPPPAVTGLSRDELVYRGTDDVFLLDAEHQLHAYDTRMKTLPLRWTLDTTAHGRLVLAQNGIFIFTDAAKPNQVSFLHP